MPRSTLKWSVITVGASAMAAQVIFVREFLVVFKGNELSIGIILTNWLIWGAFGSGLLGIFTDKFRNKVNVFSIGQFLLGIALLGSFFFVRAYGNTHIGATGEIIGYPQIFLKSFLALAIPCTLMGFLFTLGCALFLKENREKTKAVTTVYILEAIGAMLGGLGAGYFMVKYLPLFFIIIFISVLNIINAVILQHLNAEKYKAKRTIKVFLSVVSFMIVACLLFGGGSYIDRSSRENLWRGFSVIATDNSVYGNITLTQRADQVSFYENGIYLYSNKDNLSAEETVHYNLLENSDPENILLIGGGLGGALHEILKYNINRVDYVELDPLLINMAKKYLPSEDIELLNDPRVNIINQDGRYFIKQAKNKYDSIIINLGDPYTAQINRYYTVEVFNELNGLLTNDGILSFNITSNENYISDEAAEYLASIYLTAQKVFPDILVIPGDTSVFLISKTKGKLITDPAELIRRKNERGIDTLFIADYYLFDKMSEERIRYALDSIQRVSKTPVNKDFRPISYYFSIKYWSTQLQKGIFAKFFSAVKPFMLWLFLLSFVVFTAIISYFKRKGDSVFTYVTAVMTTGFSEIVFQLSIILAFQVIYGFIYQKIAIIFTSFMAGLAFGGWLYYKYLLTIKDKYGLFKKLQIYISIYPLLLPIIFILLRSLDDRIYVNWIGSNIVLPLLPTIAGIIGGIQFCAANDICFDRSTAKKPNIGRISGLNYAMDLLGSAFGAFLLSSIIIPIIGLFQACLFTSILNFFIYCLLKNQTCNS